VRSRSWWSGVAVMVVAVMVVAVGCGGGDRGSGDAANPTTSTSTNRTTTSTEPIADGCEPSKRSGADSPPGDAVGDLPVVREERTVVDDSRPTEPKPDRPQLASPNRTLPLVIMRPGDGGPYPLVVWSHGLGSAGDERNDTLERWASAGHVVVALTFPLSSRSTDSSDLRNQPADVAFVVEQIRAAAADDSDEMHGVVDGDCIALAGHSLGGGTTMAAAYDPCCAGIAPDALVDIAGVLVADTPNGRLVDMDPIPTLIVHGDADRTVPYAQSEQVAASLRGPTWFLTFTGGGHSDMFAPPRSKVLDAAVVAFLDAQLKGDQTSLDALPATVASSGQATLRTPPPSG